MIDLTIEYLNKLVAKCEDYTSFSAYGASLEDSQQIKLQDIFTIPVLFNIRGDKISGFYLRKYQKTYPLATVSSDEDSYVKETAGRLFHVAKGYGRTTLSMLYALQFAKNELERIQGQEKDESLKQIACLAPEFCFDEKIFPILVESHTLKDVLSDNATDNITERLILASICKTLDTTDDTTAKELYKQQKSIALIIDDIHLAVSDEHPPLLTELEQLLSLRNIRIYLFSDYCINCIVDEFAEDNNLIRYVLPPLWEYFTVSPSLSPDIPPAPDVYAARKFITDFFQRWYTALSTVSNRELTAEKHLYPLIKNTAIRSQIRSLTELLMLMSISIYDSVLPSDFTRMIAKLIDIKIKVHLQPEMPFKQKDIIAHLAEIAYYMLHHNTDSISQFDLELLLASRSEWFREQSFDFIDLKAALDSCRNSLHLQESIRFLQNCNYIKDTGFGYTFTFREGKNYLAALGIKNRLIVNDVRQQRFDYIKSALTNNSIHWKETVIHLAVMDEKLRRQIIDYLLQLSETASLTVRIPYITYLLQLATTSGITLTNAQLIRLLQLTAITIAHPDPSSRQTSVINDLLTTLFHRLSPEKRSLFTPSLFSTEDSNQ